MHSVVVELSATRIERGGHTKRRQPSEEAVTGGAGGVREGKGAEGELEGDEDSAYGDGWIENVGRGSSDEGIYAWVVANHALGTLGSFPLDTTGIIELGGAYA
ncbi:unnamed protein product [Lupinus luteus]|uniref:Uncharacterized protein n=1 Tax=Lupinus luteus TaxID=3873 RepID=A0AAV1Y1U7_LUPLU